MWILVGILVSSFLAGVNADESRTALIASGCVAGALLVAAVGVLAVCFILRHKRRKVKKPISTHSRPVANGFSRFNEPPSQSSSISVPEGHTEEPRSLGAKAFTQHAAYPRQRPPVAFYTMRADSRMHPDLPGIINMGSPGYGRPLPVGQPVIFLDWNGAPIHTPDEGAFTRATVDPEDRPSRHRSKESSRDRRHKSRSKSRSRSRETLTATNSRHNDTNLPSLKAVPGDVIMKTRNGGPGIHSRNMNENSDNNNNRYQMKDINIEDEALTRSFVTHTMVDSSRRTVKDENKYVAEGGPYSLTQLQTNATTYPSAISATSFTHGARVNDVTETTSFRGSDPEPFPSPLEDYPNDTPRESGFSQTTHTVITEIRSVSNAVPDNEQEVKETPWVDLPQLKAADNIYEDRIIYDAAEFNTTPTTTAQFGSHFLRKDYGEKEEIITLSHRQDPTLIRPPSPPAADRPPTPPFDAMSLIYPTTLSLAKSSEKMTTDVGRIPTPPPDMSPVLDDYNIDRTSLPLNPPSFSPGNVRRRPPTPPPGLIKQDSDINIDDILNIGKEPSVITEAGRHSSSTEAGRHSSSTEAGRHSSSTETGRHSSSTEAGRHSSSTESTHNAPPFMEELIRRQRSKEDAVRYSPPTSTLSAIFPPAATHFEDMEPPPIPKNKHTSLLQRSMVVQFSEHPPEIFHREDSHDSGRQTDHDKPKDFWMETESTSPPAPPPPPPLPPSLLK